MKKMSKNGKTKNPTNVGDLTSILKWRLSKPITIDDVERMLKLDIINEEEAKQLLFNEVGQDTTNEREAALKEQIKFLEGIIEKLSDRGLTIWPQVTYVPTYPVKYWYTSIGTGNVSNVYTYSSAANTVSLGTGLTGASGTTSTTINNSIN